MRPHPIAFVVTALAALTVGACGSDSPSTADGDAVEVLFPDAVDLDTANPDVADITDTLSPDTPDTIDVTPPDTLTPDTTPTDT
ncbi:MAG TPA: hypothetical protein PK095_10200, partial [Myxococcota bacterium]|nr:hypothetical protein [Myxococcota bacterium]